MYYLIKYEDGDIAIYQSSPKSYDVTFVICMLKNTPNSIGFAPSIPLDFIYRFNHVVEKSEDYEYLVNYAALMAV